VRNELQHPGRPANDEMYDRVVSTQARHRQAHCSRAGSAPADQ
jgi:hypothetical protein